MTANFKCNLVCYLFPFSLLFSFSCLCVNRSTDIRFVLDRSMKASTRATRAERMAEAVEREIEMMIGRHRHYEEWDVSKEAEPMDEEEVRGAFGHATRRDIDKRLW